MGVPGLWTLVAPAKEMKTLYELSTASSSANVSGFRGLRVAIDASMLMVQAIKAIAKQDGTEKASLTKGQTIRALSLLFTFSSALLRIPGFLPLFVHDGPGRPANKRGQHISRLPFRMEHRLKSICEALGFDWWQAPGEAEWEMATFAKAGWVDACWTGDSDIFLAAPALIIRLPGTFEPLLTPDLANLPLETYTQAGLLSAPTTLSPADFLCLTICIGGDYADGLLPRPPRSEGSYTQPPREYIAALVNLAHSSYPAALSTPLSSTQTFSTALLQASYLPPLLRTTSLSHWSALSLTHLRRLLPSRISLALSPPTDWPPVKALALYLNPLVSTREEIESLPLVWPPARVQKILNCLIDVLLGSRPAEIREAFYGTPPRTTGLWDGLLLAWWRREALRREKRPWTDLVAEEPLENGADLEVIEIVEERDSRGVGREMRVRMGVRGWERTLEAAMREAKMGDQEAEGRARAEREHERSVWVPEEVVKIARPGLAKEWKKARRRIRDQQMSLG